MSIEHFYSDPTYEAWKLLSLSLPKNLQLLIPILPMRHGNYQYQLATIPLILDSDPTYEAWKLDYHEDLTQSLPSFRSYL